MSGSSCDRRKFIKKTGSVLLSSAALSTGIIKSDKVLAAITGSREINIGTFGPSHCSTPFVYTKLRGFFKEGGLSVNLINYPTMPLIAKDLVSGKLDFGQLVVPLVFAIHTGAKPFTSKTPMVITQITGTNGAALMVKKGSGITGPMDFRGKRMANHSKLSVHYLINMMFLESYGLDYKKDVDFSVIQPNEVVDAMKNDEIDTFVMPEPKDAITEAKGIGEVYLLSKYIWPNHPCCSLVTRKEFFDKNRALVTDVTRMMTKGALLANLPETRVETIDVIRSSSDYKYDKVPREVLLKAFTPGRSDFYPFPYQSTALLIIEIMKRYNLLSSDINNRKLAQDVFQSDLSRKIMAELDADPPETNYRIEKILGKLKDFSA